MSWGTSVTYPQAKTNSQSILSDPYETVTFFVGGRAETDWVWSDGSPVEAEADRCEDDHHVGDCLAIVWDQERQCRFSLTDINCKLRDRFICEREPQ